MIPSFVHLHVHSPYSLLDGASDIEDLVRAAAQAGMKALALTDHNSVAGAVKFVELSEKYGLKPVLGTEVTLEDDSHLTLLAMNPEGYANICRLLTLAYTHGDRLAPRLPWSALESCSSDLFCLSGCRKGLIPSQIRSHRPEQAREKAIELRDLFGESRFFLELQQDFTPDACWVNEALVALAQEIGVGCVATNNVHYARPDDALGHEVLRCIATKTTINDIHAERPLNNERYLKTPAQMADLFRWHPEALENTVRIAEQCELALPAKNDVTPFYPVPERFENAAEYLAHLTYKGATARYKDVTDRIEERLNHELAIIDKLGYNDYFLMVWSVVRWARYTAKIRCTGRGSAADSCVAYCLGLTDVDVLESDLPFARFLTEGKSPDIDIDFPSDRRDEVFEYIQQTYGERNVAMVCTFATFRAKSAVRDIGKALALPADALEFLSDHLSSFIRADQIEPAFEKHAELRAYQHLKGRFAQLFRLCARIANFPRHIATHSSGIIISRQALDALSPLQPTAKGLVRVIQFDKDDAETIGFIKFDVLALRILSSIQDAERDILRYDPAFRYDRIPLSDPATFAMMRGGGAIGVFQFESAAQIALATRLYIERFEDLIAAVALIRPGPVRGNAVSRFVELRNGWDRVDYLHPCLVPILKRTFGVIIFQEQVISVVAAMVGCSEADADRFRKSLSKHDRAGTMDEAREWFVRHAMDHHPELPLGHALALFAQLEGWGGYGFTEGHAHSFSITGFKTAYMAHHHPAPYFASLLNHQPMGYYSANSLCGEARRRGIDILGVDINASEDKSFAADEKSIRLGFRLVAGLREEDVAAIVEARKLRPFASLLDFCIRVPMHRDRLENLILCGAFEELHPHRRGLMWRLDETLARAVLYRAEANLTEQGRLDYSSLSHRVEAAVDWATLQDRHPERSEGSACTLEKQVLRSAQDDGGGRVDPSGAEVYDGLETPVAATIPDLSPWDKFLWTWRITGVGVECHAFAYLREHLDRFGILNTEAAKRQPRGTRVTVAGLNVRPHRPPTKSGEPVLFTSVEDEHGVLQATVVGEAIWETTAVFLTSAVVIVSGVIEKFERGVSIRVESAKTLRMEEFVEDDDELCVEPPAARTYPGTKLVAAH